MSHAETKVKNRRLRERRKASEAVALEAIRVLVFFFFQDGSLLKVGRIWSDWWWEKRGDWVGFYRV